MNFSNRAVYFVVLSQMKKAASVVSFSTTFSAASIPITMKAVA